MNRPPPFPARASGSRIARRFVWALAAVLALAAALAACTGGLPAPAQIASAGPDELATLEAGLRGQITATDRDPAVLNALARVLLRENRAEEAAPLALEASQLAPFRGDYLRTLGEVQMAQGERFRAALAFSQAARVDPQNLDGYWWLGRVRRALGQSQAAKEAYLQAIKIEPDYYEAHLELARLLLEAPPPLTATAATTTTSGTTTTAGGKPAGSAKAAATAATAATGIAAAPGIEGATSLPPLVEAAQQIAEARRIRPRAPEAALLHVRILEAQGFFADAQFVAEQALRENPKQPDLLRQLIDIHRQRQDWADMKSALDRLEALGEPTPEDRVARADYLDGTGDAAGAAALRAELLRKFPKEPAVLIAGARGMLSENRPAEALRALEAAVQAAPQDADARYWKAVAHYALGQKLEGDLALNRAEALQGTHPGVRLLRVRRLLAERQLGEAAPRLNAFLAEHPADREGLLLQAELLTMMGDYAGAERQLDLLPPEHPGVRFARARLDYLRGRYRGALESLAPLVALPRPPWEAVYLGAAAQARLGEAVEAQKRIRPFLESEPPAAGPAFYRLAGVLAYQSGDPKAAERFYQRGLRGHPRDPGLLEGISRLAVEREAWKDARPWLEAGVERESPFLPLMLDRLALVYRKLGETERAQATQQRFLETTDPLMWEGHEPADPAILYRMTLPTLGLALKLN